VKLLIKIENEYKNKQKINDNIINDKAKTTAALAADEAAQRLIKGAGPIGMLAAGALGIASHFLFKSAGNDDYEEEYYPSISKHDLLIVAYYLSKYDHMILFGPAINSSKVFDAFSDIFNIKANTIRSKRDYFDALIPTEDRVSKRRGYDKDSLRSIQDYEKIILEYKDDHEENIRKKVLRIIEKYKDSFKDMD